jgi:tetratricopeptide (TPR) repeat protein
MAAALFAFVCVLSVVIYFILSANQQRAKQKYQDQLDQPDPFDDAYQRALGHVRQGNPSEALTEIKECVRLQPSSAKAFNLMGDCYNALNQLDDADYAYGEAIKLATSNYVDPQLGMAEIWVKRGELQSAIDLCQEVIEHTKGTMKTKEPAEAYLKIGLIYMLGDHKPEAMECYRELQKLDEESANRLFERIHQET